MQLRSTPTTRLNTSQLSPEEKKNRLAFGRDIVKVLNNYALSIQNDTKLYQSITELTYQIRNYYFDLIESDQLISTQALYLLILQNIEKAETNEFRNHLYVILLLFIDRFELEAAQDKSIKAAAEKARKILLELTKTTILSNALTKEHWELLQFLIDYFATRQAPTKIHRPKSQHLPSPMTSNEEDTEEDHIEWVFDPTSLPIVENKPIARVGLSERVILTHIKNADTALTQLRAQPQHDIFGVGKTITIAYPAKTAINDEILSFNFKYDRLFQWLQTTAQKLNCNSATITNLTKINNNTGILDESELDILQQKETNLSLFEKEIRAQFEKEKLAYTKSSNKNDARLIERLDEFLLLIQRVNDFRQSLRKMADLYIKQPPIISGIGEVCQTITLRIINEPDKNKRNTFNTDRDGYFKLSSAVERDAYTQRKIDVVNATISQLSNYEIDRKNSFNLLRRFNNDRKKQITRLVRTATNFIDTKNIQHLLSDFRTVKAEIESEYKTRSATNSDLYKIIVKTIAALEKINNDELKDVAHQSQAKNILVKAAQTNKKGMLGDNSPSAEMQKRINEYKKARNEKAIASFKNSLQAIAKNSAYRLNDHEIELLDEVSHDYLDKMNEVFFAEMSQLSYKQYIAILHSPLSVKYQEVLKKYADFSKVQTEKFYDNLTNKLRDIFTYLAEADYVDGVDPETSATPTALDWLTNAANLQRGLQRITQLNFFNQACQTSPKFLTRFKALLEEKSLNLLKNETRDLTNLKSFSQYDLEKMNQVVTYLKKPTYLFEFQQKKYPPVNNDFLSNHVIPAYLNYLTYLSKTNDVSLIEKAKDVFTLDLVSINKAKHAEAQILLVAVKKRYAYLLFSQGNLSLEAITAKTNQLFTETLTQIPDSYAEALKDFFSVYQVHNEVNKPDLERTRGLQHPNLISRYEDTRANIVKANHLLKAYPQFEFYDVEYDKESNKIKQNVLFKKFIHTYIGNLIQNNQIDEVINLSHQLAKNFSKIIANKEFLDLVYAQLGTRNRNDIITKTLLEKLQGFAEHLNQSNTNMPTAIANAALEFGSSNSNSSLINKLLLDINEKVMSWSHLDLLFAKYDHSLFNNYKKEVIALSPENKIIWKSLFTKELQLITQGENFSAHQLSRLHLIAYAYCDKHEQQQYETLIAANNKIAETSSAIMNEAGELYDSCKWSNESLLKNKQLIQNFIDHFDNADGKHKDIVGDTLLTFFTKINDDLLNLNKIYNELIKNGSVQKDYTTVLNDYVQLLPRLLDCYSKLKSKLDKGISEIIDKLLVGAKQFSETNILPYLHATSHFFRGSEEKENPHNLDSKQKRALSQRYLLVNCLFLDKDQVNSRLKYIRSAYIQRYTNRTLTSLTESHKQPFRYNTFEKFIPLYEQFPVCAGLGTAIFSTNGRQNSTNFTQACQSHRADECMNLRMTTLMQAWTMEMQNYLESKIQQMYLALKAEKQGLLNTDDAYHIAEPIHTTTGYHETITSLIQNYPDDPRIVKFNNLLALAKRNRVHLERLLKPEGISEDLEVQLTYHQTACQEYFASQPEMQLDILLDRYSKLQTMYSVHQLAVKKANELQAQPSIHLIKQCYIIELLNYSCKNKNELSVDEAINLAHDELLCLLAKPIAFVPSFLEQLGKLTSETPDKFAVTLKTYLSHYKTACDSVQDIIAILNELHNPSEIKNKRITLAINGLVLNAQIKADLENRIRFARANYPWAESIVSQIDLLIQSAPVLAKFTKANISAQHTIMGTLTDLLKKSEQIAKTFEQDQKIDEALRTNNQPQQEITSLVSEIGAYLSNQKTKQGVPQPILNELGITSSHFDISWKVDSLSDDSRKLIDDKVLRFADRNVQAKATTCVMLTAFTQVLQSHLENNSNVNTKLISLLKLKYFLKTQKADLEENKVKSTEFYKLLNTHINNCDEILSSLPISNSPHLEMKLITFEKAIRECSSLSTLHELSLDEETNQLKFVNIIRSPLLNCLDTPWSEFSEALRRTLISQIEFLIKTHDTSCDDIKKIFKTFHTETSLRLLMALNREEFFKTAPLIRPKNLNTYFSIAKEAAPFTQNEIDLMQMKAIENADSIDKLIELSSLANDANISLSSEFKKEISKKFIAQISSFLRIENGISILITKLMQLNQLPEPNNISESFAKLIDSALSKWIVANPDVKTFSTMIASWTQSSFACAPKIKAALVEILNVCRDREEANGKIFDNQLLKFNENKLMLEIQTTIYHKPRLPIAPEENINRGSSRRISIKS